MTTDIAHKPSVLYLASLERITEAERSFISEDYVLSMYLAGLAVECILQAISLRDTPKHDARHDLKRCLKSCRTSIQIKIDSEGVSEHWNTVVAVWRNNLRYLSADGLLGYLRAIDRHRGIAGGREAIIKVNAGRLFKAANVVHKIGVAAWQRYTKK